MDPLLGYEIALAAVLAYAAIVYALYRSGRIGPEKTFTLLGPALMIKTRRGRSALDRWGRFVRLWTRVSDVGIALAALAMVAIVILLIFGAIASFRLTPATAPGVQQALGLPGINPFIPFTYGIVAIVVGIVLHELMHGVVARSQKIGVKSLGVLWCVIPVGAFVEQDDNEMLGATRRTRDRVAAAGVLANFALAFVFFVALSGLVGSTVQPNAIGVGVGEVVPNMPAANASIHPGDIVTSINGTATPTDAAFSAALNATTKGENVTVVYFSADLGRLVTVNVILANSPYVSGRGYLGVGVLQLTPSDIKQTLVWPFGSSAGAFRGAVGWLVLPIATIEPVSGPTTAFFHLTGPFATDPGTFWVVANLLFFLAWMNLLLGLSNSLPLVPLDGGLLFRDFAASIAARFRSGWSSARLDAFGGRAVAVASMLVLLLLAWQFVVPRLL